MKPKVSTPWPKGVTCIHKRMRYCCHPKKCGHLVCPDCGLFWDEAADNPFCDILIAKGKKR
jgi:hypothetical protein